MRKKVGIIKRVTCIGLVFLLSINSFAAIVSDNDGSAFITKAEFDALKSNFQSQIDNYNNSIDSKIDGAIASYLAGIKLTNIETINNFYDSYYVTGTNGIAWSGKADYALNASDKSPINLSIAFQSISVNGIRDHYLSGNLSPGDVAPYTWYGVYQKTYTASPRCICADTLGKLTKVQGFTFILSGTQIAYEGGGYSTNYIIGGSPSAQNVYADLMTRIKKRTNNEIILSILDPPSYTRGYVPGVIYNELLTDTTAPFVLAPLSTATDYYDYLPNDITFSDTSIDLSTDDSHFIGKSSWWNGLSSSLTRGSMVSHFYGSAIKRDFPKNIAYNNYIISDLVSTCSKNTQMKCGLALAKIDKKYKEVKVNITPSHSGYLIVYLASDADGNWGGAKSTYTTNPAYVATAGIQKTFTYPDPELDKYLFVVYLPSGSSVGTLDNIEVLGELDR